jgi:hypothetical protein
LAAGPHKHRQPRKSVAFSTASAGSLDSTIVAQGTRSSLKSQARRGARLRAFTAQVPARVPLTPIDTCGADDLIYGGGDAAEAQGATTLSAGKIPKSVPLPPLLNSHPFLLPWRLLALHPYDPQQSGDLRTSVFFFFFFFFFFFLRFL